MLNDKHSPIGKMLQGIQPKYRELSFMGGQLGKSNPSSSFQSWHKHAQTSRQTRTPPVYSIIFMMPAATFLIKSPNSCIGFLLFVFGVSVSLFWYHAMSSFSHLNIETKLNLAGLERCILLCRSLWPQIRKRTRKITPGDGIHPSNRAIVRDQLGLEFAPT